MANFLRISSNQIVRQAGRRLISGQAAEARYISPTSQLGNTAHKVSRIEQYMLVWDGKFKSLADVPAFVSRDMMERTRNNFRIGVNLLLFTFAIGGSIWMVWSGKNAHNRGESVTKNNMEWHQRYNLEQAKIEAKYPAPKF